jgi:SAM-dependent methyltransferase
LNKPSPEPQSIDQYKKDRDITILNRERLWSNANLVHWYRKLYEDQFRDISDVDGKRVLEIGSGTSPLKRFHPKVITSDVLELEYLDLIFDCHEIDKVKDITDGSLDVITLTNVLHHLKAPLVFLERAAVKLKPGGQIIFTEPFYSSISFLIYRYLHHEPSVFDIEAPELPDVVGPLASANMALPQLIFLSEKNWDQPLKDRYDFSRTDVRYFTSIAYMVTGGISRKLPFPKFLYRAAFRLDLLASRIAPRLFASFFTMVLTRKAQ